MLLGSQQSDFWGGSRATELEHFKEGEATAAREDVEQSIGGRWYGEEEGSDTGDIGIAVAERGRSRESSLWWRAG